MTERTTKKRKEGKKKKKNMEKLSHESKQNDEIKKTINQVNKMRTKQKRKEND